MDPVWGPFFQGYVETGWTYGSGQATDGFIPMCWVTQVNFDHRIRPNMHPSGSRTIVVLHLKETGLCNTLVNRNSMMLIRLLVPIHRSISQ